MSRPKPVLVTQLFDRHCLEWHPPISICFSQTCLFLLSFSVTLWDWIHEASSIPDICHFFYSSYDLEWSFQCQWWMNIFVDVGLMKTPNEIEFLSCQACRHGLTQLANWQAWQASESSYNCMYSCTHILPSSSSLFLISMGWSITIVIIIFFVITDIFILVSIRIENWNMGEMASDRTFQNSKTHLLNVGWLILGSVLWCWIIGTCIKYVTANIAISLPVSIWRMSLAKVGHFWSICDF